MTIKEKLLHDELQNKATAIAIAKQAAASEKIFDELMTCFISPNIRWRNVLPGVSAMLWTSIRN